MAFEGRRIEGVILMRKFSLQHQPQRWQVKPAARICEAYAESGVALTSAIFSLSAAISRKIACAISGGGNNQGFGAIAALNNQPI